MGRCTSNWYGALDLGYSQTFFYLSPDRDRLEKLGNGKGGKGNNLEEKKDVCLYLLTLSLLANGAALLSDFEATTLELVYGIHKVPFCGCYLPSSMVGVLISVKKYLSLDLAYPRPPPVIDLKRVTLE